MIQGAPKTPKRVISMRKSPNKVEILLINDFNSREEFFVLYSDNMGINA